MNNLVSAKELLRGSQRPDIAIKYLYANAKIRLGKVPESIRRAYLESIFSFNFFFEEVPLKIGPHSFEVSFDKLIESLQASGFDLNKEPILVAPDGYVVNGAHRTAISAALGLYIPTQRANPRERYCYEYWERKPLKLKFLDLATLTQVSLSPTVRALLVHSVVPETEDLRIREIISRSGAKLLGVGLATLSLDGYVNLKKINYLFPHGAAPPSWPGSRKSGFTGLHRHALGSIGRSPIRVFFLDSSLGDGLESIKIKLRAERHSDHNRFHTTDTHAETMMVAQSVLHEGSTQILNNRDFRLHTKMDRALDQGALGGTLWAVLASEILVGGSGALDAAGIREARDIDLVSEVPRDFKSEIDSHSEQDWYSCPTQELTLDPEKHFFFRGVKFVSLEEILKLKKLRRLGTKDKLDVSLIRKWEKGSRKTGPKIHRVSTYKRIALAGIFFAIYAFEVSVDILRKLVKKSG